MNYALHTFSLLSGFCPIGFFRLKVFNEEINASIKGEIINIYALYYFSLLSGFCPTGFFWLKVFNEAVSFNAHS